MLVPPNETLISEKHLEALAKQATAGVSGVPEAVARTLVLHGRPLRGAVFTAADHCKAHLTGAILLSARLDRVWLQGAWLDFAQLQGASLNGAQLQGAILDGSSLWRVAGAWADRVLASLEAVSFQSTAPQEERPEERRKPMTWPAWGHRWVNTVPNESAGRTAAGGLARRARHTTATGGNAAALSGRRGDAA